MSIPDRILAQAAPTSDVPFMSLPLSELATGARRLEGETYLTGGYQIRRWIETSGVPFARMSELARTWQPSRLKGIVVPREYGEPFLTATQAFDIRPTARKWLAPGLTEQLVDRYLQPGWILVTCSGSVGDAILSYAPHSGVIISHDLLRVQPHDEHTTGYLYAFLRGRFGRTMLRSSRYGSIIKHLEPEHLDDVPVPLVDEDIARMISARVRKVFHFRDEAFQLTRQAEKLFAEQIGVPLSKEQSEDGYSVRSSEMFAHRRRLDGFHFNPTANAAIRTLQASGKPLAPLASSVERVFGVPRFKHVYTDNGIAYLDSEDLFKINPEVIKFIPEVTKRDADHYFVQKGWLLMACSGQLYGLNGNVILADVCHERKIVSNHVIRIVPKEVRPGYLQVALGHPELGRPLVLRLAFGTEVPEISPDDLKDFPLIRLDPVLEAEIADRVEMASELRMRADNEEDNTVQLVDDIIERLRRETSAAYELPG